MTTTVLLHGAGTGPWVWDRVRAALNAPSVAPAVPGRQAGATPDGCAAALAAGLEGHDDIVLVVHSLAGVLVPGLAARLGTRLRHVVYVGAIVPPDGGAFADALPWFDRTVLRLLFALKPRGLKPGAAMLRHELCNDLDAATTAELLERYEAEFAGLYLTPTGRPTVPTAPAFAASYVRLGRDQSLPPARQDRMHARLPGAALLELDTGHMPMLARPEQLAQLIGRCADGRAAGAAASNWIQDPELAARLRANPQT